MEAVGSFLVLIEPFTRVYDYVKEVLEKREVKGRLKDMLLSLDSFTASIKASKESGDEMYRTFVSLELPISAQQAESLVIRVIDFYDDFSGVLSSVVAFGRECNYLISGQVEGFMDDVKSRAPEVHDFITSFGKYYSAKTDSLNLTNLPMLLRIYGPKIKRKDDEKLEGTVREGRGQLSKAMKKRKEVMHSFPRIRDRRLILQYTRSLNQLGKTTKKLKFTRNVAIELGRNTPSWFTDLIAIVEEVQKSPQLKES